MFLIVLKIVWSTFVTRIFAKLINIQILPFLFETKKNENFSNKSFFYYAHCSCIIQNGLSGNSRYKERWQQFFRASSIFSFLLLPEWSFRTHSLMMETISQAKKKKNNRNNNDRLLLIAMPTSSLFEKQKKNGEQCKTVHETCLYTQTTISRSLRLRVPIQAKRSVITSHTFCRIVCFHFIRFIHQKKNKKQ